MIAVDITHGIFPLSLQPYFLYICLIDYGETVSVNMEPIADVSQWIQLYDFLN